MSRDASLARRGRLGGRSWCVCLSGTISRNISTLIFSIWWCLWTTQTEKQRKETLYLWKYQITGKKIGGHWLEIRMRHHLQMRATGPFIFGWGKGSEGSWLSSLGERVNRLKKQCRWANKMAEHSWKPNQNSTMRYALRLDRAVFYCLLEIGQVIYLPNFLISDTRRKLTLN